MVAIKKDRQRGRPRGFDRDEAIATAQQLFQERGYEGVGVAEIGKALGITPPSFYNAFGSKAALFGAVLDRYAGSFGRFVPEALAADGNVATKIARLLREAARLYAKAGGVAGCLVIDGARGSGDAGARALTDRKMAESRAMIARHIAAEYPARADELASIVMIALKGLSAAARDGASGEELSSFADTMVAGFHVALDRNGKPSPAFAGEG